jgi:hypothetical protein
MYNISNNNDNNRSLCVPFEGQLSVRAVSVCGSTILFACILLLERGVREHFDNLRRLQCLSATTAARDRMSIETLIYDPHIYTTAAVVNKIFRTI